MNIQPLPSDNSAKADKPKSGKTWDTSTHSGLSPIQFAFLKKYLDKNF